MRVQIDARLLRGFVRRCKRRYPNEYIEGLFGWQNKDGFKIVALEEIEHEADNETVTYDASDIQPFEKRGRAQRLGTIHSHPDEAEGIPSEHDWLSQRDQSEAVAGICCIWPVKTKRGQQLRTKTHFYLANALLDVERT